MDIRCCLHILDDNLVVNQCSWVDKNMKAGFLLPCTKSKVHKEEDRMGSFVQL